MKCSYLYIKVQQALESLDMQWRPIQMPTGNNEVNGGMDIADTKPSLSTSSTDGFPSIPYYESATDIPCWSKPKEDKSNSSQRGLSSRQTLCLKVGISLFIFLLLLGALTNGMSSPFGENTLYIKITVKRQCI